MNNKEYVILGLGVFGSTIAKTLSQFGCEILAIDKDPECVARISPFVTKAIIGDVTNQQLLIDLGVKSFDVGIVAIGSHLEESLLAIMNLKEAGVPYIIAKAKNKRYKMVLEQLGIRQIVQPEKQMGEKIARMLMRKNIIDLVELDNDYSIVEMKAPFSWVGYTLASLDLRRCYGINVLGKRDMETMRLTLTVDPNYRIQKDDYFLMLAKTDIIEKYDYYIQNNE